MPTLLWKGEASLGQGEEANLAGHVEEAEGQIRRMRWRCAVDGPTQNRGRTGSDQMGLLTAYHQSEGSAPKEAVVEVIPEEVGRVWLRGWS